MTAVLDQAIVNYVDAIEAVRGQDLSFRPDAKAPLPPEAQENLPHFLLLSASIDAGVDSWHIRLLLADLAARLRAEGGHDGLFGVTAEDAELIDATIQRHQRQRRLGGYQARRFVLRILGDVNAFVAGPAAGDLDTWATQFDRPADAVQALATAIYWQGREPTEPRKKMWMFLRWLVRPHPDLRRWEHFDPADLVVPTDRHVAGFALAAGIIDSLPSLGPRCAHAQRITAWAAQYWPADPARVDYGFYLWVADARTSDNRHQTLVTPRSSTPADAARSAAHRCPAGADAPVENSARPWIPLVTKVSSYQPQQFAVSVSAGMGDGFEANLHGGSVHYLLSDPTAGSSEVAIEVTPQHWRSFRKSLHRLDAAAWSGHYEPSPEALRTDGVDWKVEIAYADGEIIRSSGYDAFPPDGDVTEPSKPFKHFCRAVSRLLGGVEFGWEVAKPPEPKGSQLRLYEWVHHHREELELELCRQNSSLGDFMHEPGASINWIAPDGSGKEIRDGLWPLVLPGPSPQEDGFWPAGGPVWDGAGLVAGRGDNGVGLVLIEAKAHAAELVSPRMQPSSYEVDQQRRAAMDEAKVAYGVEPAVPWTLTYYQLANRLAFLYYLRVRRRQPAWLINLYFYGDSFKSGGKDIVGPTDKDGWADAIVKSKRALGLGAGHHLGDYVVDVFPPAVP